MRKGLSPIISVILVLLIAIATTVLAIMWLPRLTIKIFNVESSFNQSYVRSRGCLNIEYVDPYKREITIKNCGKISLSDFKLFIDSSEVSLLSIGDIKPMEETVVNYNKCLSKRDFYDFYLTADLAESPAIKVDLSLPIVALDSVPSTIEDNESYYCIDEDMHSSDTMFSFALGVNNVVLDCNGHELSGDGQWGSTGIYLSGNHNITIKNCKITDFWSGIYLRDYSDGNNINNVTTYDNDYGIYFTESSDNKITNSNSYNNNAYDFLIETYNEKCNNEIRDLIGTDDLPIYYHSGSPVTISGWDNTVSEIVLCDADNSNINNVNLDRIGRRNNGILLVGTDDSTIDNVNVKGYEAGIYLYNSLNNQITNIIADENDYGIYVDADSNANNLDNIRTERNYYGLTIWNSAYNRISNSNLTNSYSVDFLVSPWECNHCKNELNNVMGTENKPIYYHNNSAVTISDWRNNVSEILLCCADGSKITNVSLDRDEVNYPENNGIILSMTDYSNITDVNVTDLDKGIYLRFSSSYNTLKNVRAISNYYGMYIFENSNNNTITDSRMIDNNVGTFIDSWGGYPEYNNITNCSISQNLEYDYSFSEAGETNGFTDTNFTAPRAIRFGGLPSWFNYRNSTINNIWLKTSVSYSYITINRRLLNWNKTLIQWNDSSSGSVTATYNVSGLFLNNYYNVYDNSALLYSLFSGSNGQITFTINLPANQEHEIKVKGICDYYIFSSDMINTYSISQSNKLYCLVENVRINGKNAISFSSGVFNTTLYCSGYNLDSNDTVGTIGIYLGSANNNNTVNNCNVTNFDDGIHGDGATNNVINNVTTSSNNYGISFDSSLNLSINNVKSFSNVNGGLFFWTTNNTKIVNASSYSNNYGIWFHTSYKNDVKNSSFSNNNLDYHLQSADKTNNFTSTNFTSNRTIYIEDSISWFNYNNETTGNIWLKTSVSAQAMITRKLLNWSTSLMRWNDTASAAITARYNITDLLTNIDHSIYNISDLVYTINSGPKGEISFTINLPASQEREIIVNRSSNVLLFNFNESIGTKIYDKSIFGNNGTYYGETFNDGIFYGETFNDGRLGDGTCNPGSGSCPNRTNGYSGKALSFDGLNDFANFSNSSSLSTTSLTVMFWLNLASDPNCDGNNNWRSLIRKGSTAGTPNGWDVVLEENRNLQFDIGNGTSNENRLLSPSGIVPVNQWVHLAFVYNRTNGNQIIYKNGILNVSRTVTVGFMQPNSQPILLSNGTNAVACPNQAGYINGTIDEVRIWNRTLSQAEISAEMNSSLPMSRPIASYRFEENGNYVNDTHIRVNGTYGSALSFDGIDDYLRVNSVFGGITQPITIGLWLRFENSNISENTNTWPISIGDAASANHEIRVEWGAHRVQYYIFNNTGESTMTSSYDITDNNWHYITTRANSTHIELLIDNNIKETKRYFGTIRTPTTYTRIGLGTAGSLYRTHDIDEVRIWNRSLTQAEILAEMSSSMPVSRPIASYRFEESSGQYANDTHIWVSGTYGSALSFDGINDYVEIPHSDSISGFSEALTVSFWIKQEDLSRRQTILSKYNNVDYQKGWFVDGPSSSLNERGFYAAWSDGINYSEWHTANPTTNTWYYLTVVWRSNNKAQFYVNATSVSTGSDTVFSSIYNNIGIPLLIGKCQYQTNRYFNGTLDEVRIWDRVLSQTEIQTGMSEG